MRSKRVIRYYCDHCSKGSLTRDSMERHERRCFSNAERLCEVCENGEAGAVLVQAMEEGGIEKLRQAADNCPACILAGIIQHRKAKPDSEQRSEWFDYKTERAEWDHARRIDEVSNFGWLGDLEP